jgi:MFS family permease
MTATNLTSNAQLRFNVPKYFLYAALKNFALGLFVAVWVIYLQERRGLNLAQATVVDVTFLITATFGELPTGIVADTYGRKTSMIIGSALMAISMLAWPVVPTLLLVIIAYAGMAIGFTFLSGADEALFFESLKSIDRGREYQRLAGQIGAVSLGSFAIGNAVSGLLASVDLIIPFLGGGLCIVFLFCIVLTLREPPTRTESGSHARNSYGGILRVALTAIKIRPALRYPMFYLAFMPLAGFLLETFLVQPQVVLFGLPVAAIGFIIMAIQFVNIAGSNWSQQISRRLGEKQVIYLSPLAIVASLVLLALFQAPPSLLFIAVIGFVTAILQPLVMNRIQAEVSDDIRATILSMQSLFGSLLMAIGELAVGFVANQVGLPTAYIVLAIGLSTLSIVLLWNSRSQFPQSAESI